jgi:glycosyltransferase involved in cell wall biosynthesis
MPKASIRGGIGPQIRTGLGEAVNEGNGVTVSLVMIVRNEERNLADCLAPVASLFDEIVIVDTGSVDDTRRIAGRFTPHVFEFPWCDDFSAARNEALRHATGDWLFWLDADDRLSETDIAKLRSLLHSLGQEPRAYFMNTACSSQYACEGETLITHPRLFRRHADLRWQGRVHEQLRPEPASLGYELFFSDVLIRHVGYSDASALQRKLNRDVRLLRMDYAVDPSDPSTLLHLGLAYFHLGRTNEARQYLRQLLAATTVKSDYLRQVFCVLATIEMREGKLLEALAVLDQGLSLFPRGDYLLYLRADCLYELDRFREAKATLINLLTCGPKPQYRGGIPAEIVEKLAPRKLADILRLERDFASAETLFRSLINRFSDDTLSWYLLGRVYLDSRQRANFLAVTEQLRFCPQGEIFASLLLATWHLDHNELDAAAPLIDKLIGLAPRMPLPRVLRADLLARAGAPIPDRIHACRDILRLHPGNLDAQRMIHQLELAQSQLNAAVPIGSGAILAGEGLSESVGA